MSQSKIVINATALDRGGALTILKQFINAVPNDELSYLIFVSSKITIENRHSNITLVKVDVKSFIKRFFWDAWGLKKYLKRNNINPIAGISLQNTNFRIGCDVPNFVYYHQPIPFYDVFWSPLNAQQRLMWFYKHIYPFFVKLFINSKTEIFVQLKYIKYGFAKKINFPQDRIHIITPDINIPQVEEVNIVELERNKINLFYPAMPYFYKNHKVIIDAISKLKTSNVVLYLTCNKEDLNYDFKDIVICFMGVISYEKVLHMYNKADALLFPSYIETFGLPLIEAASFGIPVLAADLPYSREVLKGYTGVQFLDFADSDKWALSISKLEKEKRYKPFSFNGTNSWQELFRIVKDKISNNV